MIVAFFLMLAVLFGALVLVILFVGRKYEIRHHVGDMDKEMDKDEEQSNIVHPNEESDSKENL